MARPQAGTAVMRLPDVVALLRRHLAGRPTRANFRKGEEMGWFEHGSTIITFIPEGYGLCPGIQPGQLIRMGEALLHRLTPG